MILLDSLEVFNVSASSSFLYLSVFSYRIFKNGRLSGASFQHNSSNDQFSSGDSTVLRTAKKSCGECSPEVPGIPRQANSADLSAEKCTKFIKSENFLVFYS